MRSTLASSVYLSRVLTQIEVFRRDEAGFQTVESLEKRCNVGSPLTCSAAEVRSRSPDEFFKVFDSKCRPLT